MIAEKMIPMIEGNSVIRKMFEEGKQLAKEIGAENVFDFSLGNPNQPAPSMVKEAIYSVLENEESTFVHGYMNNAGYEDVRGTIANSLNSKYETNFSSDNIIMTVGAAGGLNIILKTLINPEDEVIVFAPYFVEYGAYVKNYDGKLVVIDANTIDFQPNLEGLISKISEKTKAVIINSPNNPTGVVYSEETIQKIATILQEKQIQFGTSIALISDEPYRELVYQNIEVPYVTKYYKNTVICYSYSKSLSLPGERIGYLVIPNEFENQKQVFAAATIANRIIGSVNAPSLMQRVIKYCIENNVSVNMDLYEENRRLLYEKLSQLGFHCINPQGGFYLFVKSPVEQEEKFCQMAKKHHILLVPGSAFACPGYVRLAYCVSNDKVKRSLEKFELLAKEYGLN